MTLRQLVLLIALATGLLWAGWGWTIYTIDPEATNWLGFLFFYLIFLLSMTGTLALIGLFIRNRRRPDILLHHLVSVSFRQAVLLSSFLTVLLALQGQRLVRLWNMGLTFVLVVVVELIFAIQSVRRSRRNKRDDASSEHPFVSAAQPGPRFSRKEMSEEQSPGADEATMVQPQ